MGYIKRYAMLNINVGLIGFIFEKLFSKMEKDDILDSFI